MTGETLRLRVELGYDGAPFKGWARQPGLPSVQGALEDALELIFRAPCATVVAGRTDTGVHARRQTVHVDVPAPLWARFACSRPRGPLASDADTGDLSAGGPADVQDVAARDAAAAGLTRKLNGALNRVLGKDRAAHGWDPAVGAIVVRDVAVAPEGFDARFSALSRGYTYRVADAVTGHDPLTRTFSWWVPWHLDVPAMDRAVRELLGLHDFLSFCKPREGATTIRDLQRAGVHRDESGMITIVLQADAFCHHMVRCIVGAVVRVGEGRYDAAWPGQRLRARVRDANVLMAPAHGLVLDAVRYPDPSQLADRARLTRARRPAQHDE